MLARELPTAGRGRDFPYRATLGVRRPVTLGAGCELPPPLVREGSSSKIRPKQDRSGRLGGQQLIAHLSGAAGGGCEWCEPAPPRK